MNTSILWMAWKPNKKQHKPATSTLTLTLTHQDRADESKQARGYCARALVFHDEGGRHADPNGRVE